jgi:hypothetical protein
MTWRLFAKISVITCSVAGVSEEAIGNCFLQTWCRRGFSRTICHKSLNISGSFGGLQEKNWINWAQKV